MLFLHKGGKLTFAHRRHSCPWIHSLFLHKHFVLQSHGYCQSVSHWITGFLQVSWGLTAVTLIHNSSFVTVTFWINTLVALDERLATRSHNNTINNKGRICCIGELSRFEPSNNSDVSIGVAKVPKLQSTGENQIAPPDRFSVSSLPKFWNKTVV